MRPTDPLFETRQHKLIWDKYCGFLRLPIREFMELQEELLREQIETVFGSPLARGLMKDKPRGLPEFRQTVPLTASSAYFPRLNERTDSLLAVEPMCWTHTSGRGGAPKWMAYTEPAFRRLTDYGVAAILLSCAQEWGDVGVGPGVRLLYNVPPKPYMPGFLAHSVAEAIGAVSVLGYERLESADFASRLQSGFQAALRTGVDVLGSLTGELVKMAERFSAGSRGMGIQPWMANPRVLSRFLRAARRARREGRTILPKDLWDLKGLIAYGMDTAIYRDELVRSWGREPLEGYAATEIGGMGTQTWTKRHMSFVPTTCFYEFIPWEEWEHNRREPDHVPATVLLPELEPGKKYEVVVSSFYGMPLLRYRIGDILQIASREDTEAGVPTPQFSFHSRADDLIDIAGFARLDERSLWQAIVDSRLPLEEWTARKEYADGHPVLRLYAEMREPLDTPEITRVLQRHLELANPDYRDLRQMLGREALVVTTLPAGAFRRYYLRRQKEGADLAHLKPPHMNPGEQVLRDLLAPPSSGQPGES